MEPKYVQLDLFPDSDEISQLKAEVRLLRAELGNVRRGLFKRHSDLSGEFLKVLSEVEHIKQEIRNIK